MPSESERSGEGGGQSLLCQKSGLPEKGTRLAFACGRLRAYVEMYSRKLCCTAYAAASARLFTPSFERMLET